MSATVATGKMSSPPKLNLPVGSIVTPGDRLGNIRQAIPGEGTYERGGHIYASIVGSLQVDAAAGGAPESGDKDVLYSCCIRPRKPPASKQVLQVGQLVLGRVIRIAQQNAIIELSVAQHVGALVEPHEGAIRKEDVRTGASETIQMYDCFQPGDIVLSRVLGLGDSRRYFLTTAEPELGVVRAVSKTTGVPMIPVSWKEMECPDTGVKELRKCAKPGGLLTKSATQF